MEFVAKMSWKRIADCLADCLATKFQIPRMIVYYILNSLWIRIKVRVERKLATQVIMYKRNEKSIRTLVRDSYLKEEESEIVRDESHKEEELFMTWKEECFKRNIGESQLIPMLSFTSKDLETPFPNNQKSILSPSLSQTSFFIESSYSSSAYSDFICLTP